jgi:hypothetical protein
MRPVYSEGDREGSYLRNERFGRAAAHGLDGRMRDPDRATNLPRIHSVSCQCQFSIPQHGAERHAGHFGYSFIVHFDAERSFGVVPAPVVTFPMVFPLVIALIRLGVPPETAASLISILLYSARMYHEGLTSVVSYACACSYHSPAFVGD